MQSKHGVQRSGDAKRAGVVESSVAPPSKVMPLPAWESFPEQQRRQLVHALLQAARRQIEQPRSTDGLLRK